MSLFEETYWKSVTVRLLTGFSFTAKYLITCKIRSAEMVVHVEDGAWIELAGVEDIFMHTCGFPGTINIATIGSKGLPPQHTA